MSGKNSKDLLVGKKADVTHAQAHICPKCGGSTGHEHVMTESHVMIGLWGSSAQAVDSGGHVRPVIRSFVQCLDCGVKFKHEALRKNGLV